MKRTFGLCVLLFIVINAKNSVVLSSTTVNLVSVLRRDLMKDNEDFDEDEPALPPAPAAPAAPFYPTRRAEFLQPNKLLEVDDEATDYVLETYTFQIQQSPTLASTTQLPPGTPEVRAAHSKAKHKKTKTTTSAETSILATVSGHSELVSSADTERPTFNNYDVTEKQQLRFNDALRLSMNRSNPNKQKYPNTPGNKKPQLDLNKLKDHKEHIATKTLHREAKVNASMKLAKSWQLNTAEDEMASDYENTPDPQVLDLAPATGFKVLKMRNKHRICDRNVLKPEGPKYDYRGKVYHEAHTNKQDFAVTVRPKYIIPRCCNCCRKSLLGCE